MSERRQTDLVVPGTHKVPDRHLDERPSALASWRELQSRAGNRAVAGLLAPSLPAHVQREPFGARRPAESPNQLHLDPQIEAQLRAINAMNAMIAPEPVRAGLLDLTLPQIPLASGPEPASSPPLPTAGSSTPAAPSGPAPGTGLMGPRAGTAGDVWKAIVAEPSLGPSITALGDQAAARAKAQWDQLSTGTAVVMVTGSVAVGGGAIVTLLANRDVRQWITSTLNDKIIPVPKVPGLGLQLNLSGENIIVGVHLDVGKILPAALGFGPASQTTPLGTPFPETAQRQDVVQRQDAGGSKRRPIRPQNP